MRTGSYIHVFVTLFCTLRTTSTRFFFFLCLSRFTIDQVNLALMINNKGPFSLPA